MEWFQLTMVEDQGKYRSSETSNGYKANVQTPVSFSTSRKGLLNDSDTQSGFKEMKTTLLNRLRIPKFSSGDGLASPSGKFWRIAEERDETSRSVPSTPGLRVHFNNIDWPSVWKTSKKWIRKPMNMALFLWIVCVGVSGAILFLVMTGMLNGALPKKSQRNAWFEVNNQIINALFTLMCLYQHPKRFHHLVLLCRWKPNDISLLRKIYCKNGTPKPYERAHMTVVILLLHLNCFAQYALCGLNLGYKRSKRPALGVGVCLAVAISAPAFAGLYSFLCPLGKEYNLDEKVDEEAQSQTLRVMSSERRFSFASTNDQRIVENSPVWVGGLFDFWENITLAYLSIFCTCCVFGWNMERLGFGNMYVHIATFALFCTAPFWIFNLAAINIENETVREAFGVTGVVLCVFGLLYGGFWRIQMRKRFNLPANNSCCGKPAISDCAQWLFCSWCSLVQEVKTADFYDIAEDKFCRKQTDESSKPPLSPLPREDGWLDSKSNPSFPIWDSPRISKLVTENYAGPSRFSKDSHNVDRELFEVEEEFSPKGTKNSLKPPIPLLIQREDNNNQRI